MKNSTPSGCDSFDYPLTYPRDEDIRALDTDAQRIKAFVYTVFLLHLSGNFLPDSASNARERDDLNQSPKSR